MTIRGYLQRRWIRSWLALSVDCDLWSLHGVCRKGQRTLEFPPAFRGNCICVDQLESLPNALPELLETIGYDRALYCEWSRCNDLQVPPLRYKPG
jgi:hypothetical protein